jgi:hypothetical protein
MKPTKKTASTKTTTTTKPASTAAATANKGPLSGNTGKNLAHFRIFTNASPNEIARKSYFLIDLSTECHGKCVNSRRL